MLSVTAAMRTLNKRLIDKNLAVSITRYATSEIYGAVAVTRRAGSGFSRALRHLGAVLSSVHRGHDCIAIHDSNAIHVSAESLAEQARLRWVVDRVGLTRNL